jgi:GTP cyclohydrolase II
MPVTLRTSVPIPLTDQAIATHFVSFSGFTDGKEHIAIIYGAPEQQDAPLVRIHSECLTGDVFGSQRCDCGEQLQEAQRLMAVQGGVVLYLRQEGRGIGLYNKLDAYDLQDQGMDTYQANEQLGFDHDQRNFAPAVQMLEALGLKRIRLLSNNPHKADELLAAGIEISERVDTGVYVNRHNAGYLKAKVDQQAHRIKLPKSAKSVDSQ